MKAHLLLFALLALAVPTNVSGQQLQAKLSHYSTDQGLPSNAVSKIINDDYGYIWIATWNGLSRFDGFNFYNYATGNASGIKGLHNRINNIVVDQAQNVWLKMYDGRLFVINRQTDCIEDPMRDVTDHEDFSIDYFFTPFVTSNGDVLVSFTDYGLYKFRMDRNGLKQQHILTNSLNVTCITEGYHNDIWVGTNQGVHRVNMSNMALERNGYFLDESITHIVSNGYNIFVGTKSGKIMQFSYGQEAKLILDTGREVTGLFVDSHGLIWFSDSGDGAYRLNPETHNVKFFNQRCPIPEFTSRGAEFSEAMGYVWVRMNHGGFGYYNRETDEVEYFHNDPVNPWNLSNSVYSDLEMNDGVVWESTHRRGLEKLEILKNTIMRKQLVPGGESVLDNEIRAMYYDQSRQLLLLGNKKHALYIIDNHGNRTVLTHDSDGNEFGRFYGISKDSQGNYWLSDKDKGLYKMTPNGSGYHITNFCHHDDDKWSLTTNSAYQTVEDRRGNIWVATYGGGVNVLVKDKEGKYKVHNRLNTMKRYPAKTHQRVRTIAMDKDGKIWAGTTDGILMMSMENGKFDIERMEAPKDIRQGLASNDIVTLVPDHNGTMWVGTNGGGLSRSLEKDDDGYWHFENFGIAQGLPSEEIRSMTFDQKGNVWFATDHILCSLNTEKDILSTFSYLDGVDDTMCSEGAAVAMPNGNILFGTQNGYYVVDLNRLITKTGSLLKLRITDFFLNNELQSPRLNSTFSQYIPESKRVELPEHDASFAFRFASLNFRFQHRIHYQYRLEGYESEWHKADKQRLAIYDDVPSGTYRFQVRAFLLESPENFDMSTIEVIVPPHLLLSTTATWFYLMLIAIVGIILLWWYQKRLRKKHQPVTVIPEETFPDKPQEEEKNDEYEIIED